MRILNVQAPNPKEIPNAKIERRKQIEFWILATLICPSTWLKVVSPSTQLRTVSLTNGLSNYL